MSRETKACKIKIRYSFGRVECFSIIKIYNLYRQNKSKYYRFQIYYRIHKTYDYLVLTLYRCKHETIKMFQKFSFDFVDLVVMHINRMRSFAIDLLLRKCTRPHRMRQCTQRRMLITRNVC